MIYNWKKTIIAGSIMFQPLINKTVAIYLLFNKTYLEVRYIN